VSGPVIPPSPLPLLDLLQELQGRGLPISVREHLAVGRLLDRMLSANTPNWDVPDTALLRSSLAALLARNARESQLVRETFDRLYGETSGTDVTSAPPISFPQRFKTRWVAWGAGLAAVLSVLAYFAISAGARSRGEGPVVTPPTIPSAAPTPAQELIQTSVVVRAVNWRRAATLSAMVGALGLLGLYLRRTSEDARRHGMRYWREELDARPGPLGYDISTRGLRPAWPPGLLDDLAAILGRHASRGEQGDDIDVDRSVAATLRAGLAPQIVWRVHAATLPILVLQDLGEEMRPWRRRVDGLLDGLQARGVALDRWTFDADGSRLFRGREDPPLPLRQLARRTADSPLLVISTGQGVLEGEPLRNADWVKLLRHWRSRAWLHPLADQRYWRTALRGAAVELWPMTPDGLVGAARQLSRGESRLGERSEPRGLGERPVTPLDVQRLRWLISLAPSRDPLLAERLRQRFAPHVPPSALAEALVAPPSTEPPPVGPGAEEVHAFLAEVLAGSRPREEDQAAFDRWRVDHALQLVGAGQASEGLAELDRAAERSAPLVADAVSRLAPLSPAQRDLLRPQIQRKVLPKVQARAVHAGWDAAARSGQYRWTRPRPIELASAALVTGLFALLTPHLGSVTQDRKMDATEVYTLEHSEPAAVPGLARTAYVPGPFALTLRRRDEVPDAASRAPRTAQLFQDRTVRGRITAGGPGLSLEVADRGHWFQAQARLRDGTVAVSNLVWVPREATSGWLQVEVVDEAGGEVAGATVEISNGRQTLTTPAGARRPMPLGDWTVRVAVDGYAPQERQVTVTGGTREQPMREIVRLARVAAPPSPGPRPGYLVVNYSPDYSVPTASYVVTPEGGGVSRRGRMGEDLALEPGRWTVSISRPEGLISRRVVIREGQRTTIAPTDAPPPVILNVSPPVREDDGGTANYRIGIVGKNFSQSVEVTIEGVRVVTVVRPRNPNGLEVYYYLAPLDRGGTRTLTVRNADGSSASARVDVGPVRPDNPDPNAEQAPPVEARQSEPAYGEVGCGEERVVQAVYRLRPGERYVDASVEVLKAGNLKDQQVVAPQFDERQGQVVGAVRIRGLDRVAGSCPGGGNIAIVLRVRVRARGEAQAN
jgi:hypothetical protein